MGKLQPTRDWRRGGALMSEGLHLATISMVQVRPQQSDPSKHVVIATFEEVNDGSRAYQSFTLSQDFAIDRLAGLLEVVGAKIPPALQEHEGWRQTAPEKIQRFLSDVLEGRTVGVVVSHREGQRGTIANVDQVMTAEEAQRAGGPEVVDEGIDVDF